MEDSEYSRRNLLIRDSWFTNMKITVFGTGYVGLVQAAVLADAGHHVCCVDVDESKIADLRKGIIPIFEPGLADLVRENLESGSLIFTVDPKEGVEYGEVQYIAVGTPPDEDGSADLRYVLQVARTIATFMQSSKIIIDKSTVPVGTADKVQSTIRRELVRRNRVLDFAVVSNPEFLKEGAAVADCKKPDRIIIGVRQGDDIEKISRTMRALYAPFNRNHDRMIFMDARSAELTKYAANSMLATKISFMNEMANIAEEVGADIEEVRKGIGSDSRIGYNFIYPGCGYGGSCFPKDVQALIKTSDASGYDAEILKAVEQVNTRQKNKLFQYLSTRFSGNLAGKKIALWGLSFKPNTDDMREASSRRLMESLWSAKAQVQAYDPEAMEECRRIYGGRNDLSLCESKEAALIGADALVICTEWSIFWAPDFDLIINELNYPVIVDGRNLFEPEIMKEKGIDYYGVGRGLSVRESTGAAYSDHKYMDAEIVQLYAG